MQKKRGGIIFFVLFVILRMNIHFVQGDEKIKINLIPNPGFEEFEGQISRLKYWSELVPFPTTLTENIKGERTTEDKHSGEASYKITGINITEKQYGYIASSLIKFVSPYPTRLLLKGWVKADTLGYTYLYAWVWTKDGKLHYLSGEKLKKTDGWQEESLILECEGKEITAIRVLCIAHGAGTVYWDDFMLTVAPPQIQTNIVMCDKVTIPPQIDGNLNDACWKDATKLSSFILATKESFAVEPTFAYVCYDDTNLYIAFECFESVLDPILNKLHEFKATVKERDGPVFNDDCVEIFLDTNHDRFTYYHLAVNAIGTIYDSAEGTDGIKWDAEIKASTSIGEKSWIVEMAIPFKALNAKTPLPGEIWGINLCREEKPLKENSSWAGIKGNFHKAEEFGNLIFGQGFPIALKNLSFSRCVLGNNELTILLKNKSPEKQTVAFATEVLSANGKRRMDIDFIEVEPNLEKEIKLNYFWDKKGPIKVRFILYDPKTSIIYYSSQYSDNVAFYPDAEVNLASGSSYVLYLNGTKKGDYTGSTKIDKITFPLQQGVNTIAIKCKGDSTVKSLLAEIKVEGYEDKIVSDEGWKCSTNPVMEIEPENLIPNPGFEDIENNNFCLKYWGDFLPSPYLIEGDIKGERTTEDKHSGQASYKITGINITEKQYGYIASPTIKFLSPYPTRLLLKGWVKADTLGYTYLYAWVWTKDGKLHYLSGEKLKKTDGWQEESLILECEGKEITAIRVLCIAHGEGTVYWDDFSLINLLKQNETAWMEVNFNDKFWPNAEVVNTPAVLEWKNKLGNFNNSHCIWCANLDSEQDVYFRRNIVVEGSSIFKGINPGETLYFNNESAQQIKISHSPFLNEYDWILEIPEGFSIIPPQGFSLKKGEKRIRSGQEYQKYIFSVQPFSGEYTPVFDVKTNLPNTSFYYYCQAHNGSITELENEVKVKVLPPLTGKQPENVVFRMWYAWFPKAAWFPKYNEEEIKAIIKTAKRAGFNSAWVIDTKWPYYDEYGRETEMGKIARCFHQEGFNIVGEVGTTTRWLLPWSYLKNQPEYKGKDFQGNNIVCPTFIIEKGYEKLEEMLIKRINEYNLSGINWDLELNPYAAGFACCCQKCLDNFRIFTNLGKEVTLTPEIIKEKYHSQWVDFRCWQNAQLAKRIQEAVHKSNKNCKFEIYSGYHSEKTKNVYTVDWELLGKYCDIITCGYGIPVDLIHQTLAVTQKPLIPGILIYEYGNKTSSLKIDYLFKILVETGSSGIFIFEWEGMDAQDYRVAAKYSTIISNFEELFLNGKKDNTLVRTKTTEDFIVLKNGEERLILLFNNTPKEKVVELEHLDVEEGVMALDYNEKKVLHNPKVMKVVIPENDVKIIFLGPEKSLKIKYDNLLQSF